MLLLYCYLCDHLSATLSTSFFFCLPALIPEFLPPDWLSILCWYIIYVVLQPHRHAVAFSKSISLHPGWRKLSAVVSALVCLRAFSIFSLCTSRGLCGSVHACFLGYQYQAFVWPCGLWLVSINKLFPCVSVCISGPADWSSGGSSGRGCKRYSEHTHTHKHWLLEWMSSKALIN